MLGADNAKSTVTKILARVLARNRTIYEPAKTPPLLLEERVRLDSTSDLRGESGRLTVTKVASTFGLSTAKLASLLGSNRQAVFNTDDARSLQSKLAPFERIARLRRAFTPKQFLAWLQSPHHLLEKQSPIEVITKGGVEVVADLVEDMLAGNPT
jgi:hypothetical protein